MYKVKVESSRGSDRGKGGIEGDGLLFPVAIAGGGVMIDACHAENPARAASWICLSCDQPRKWSRDYLS